MTQQTFPTGKKPQVVITQVNGNLRVYPWDKQAISVETNGSVAELRQKGDTVIITNCESDIELWVPAIRKKIGFPITTDISVTKLSRNVTMEGVGNVELRDIGGNVALRNIGGNVELVGIREVAELTSIGGNLRATSMPTLRAQKGIGGDALLSEVAQVEIEKVGSNLWLARAETVVVDIVGGNFDVEGVEAALRCGTVGGNCQVRNSASAEVAVVDVEGNLHIDNAVHVQVSKVGGNLSLSAAFPADSHTRLIVGENATLVLPENANLSISAIVGGMVSGSSIASGRGGNFISLVYGDGTARLELNVGGNLRLLESIAARSSSIGRS